MPRLRPSSASQRNVAMGQLRNCSSCPRGRPHDDLVNVTSDGCSMAKAMARFCKAASMVPRCRGAEHAASRRGRIRIIALPTVEEVVVAVSMEPRRCGRARKHGRGREYQKSKFPCHDRASSVLTSEVLMDQSAACSKGRIRRMRGCALTFAQIPLAFRNE